MASVNTPPADLPILPRPDNPYEEFRYFYRDGMPLRPAPQRRTEKPSWSTIRHNLFDKYHDVLDEWEYDTEQTRLLDDHMWQTDELGAAVAEMFKRVGSARARKDFETALNEGIDAVDSPEPELVALFESLDSIPEWIDLEAAERGRVAYYNTMSISETLTFAFGYWATTMEDRTSAATGETRMFEIKPLQRAMETSEFFVTTGMHGVFHRFSDGFKAAVRVRLLHAQANRYLEKLWGPEHFNTFGRPIGSSFLVSGEGWFALLPLALDEFFGRPHPEQEWDDVAMYWAYILYVMGAEERIIPKNGDEMRRMTDFIFANGGMSSPYRVQIATALLKILDMMNPHAPLEALAGLSLIVGEEDTRFMISGTPWEGTDWTEEAAKLEQRARAEAAQLREEDAREGAWELKLERAQQGNPPWMKALREQIEHAEEHGLDVPSNFQLHDATTDNH